MARKPRAYSESGIYHVILRGINRKKVFEYKEEKEYLLSVLERNFTKKCSAREQKTKGQLFAFCILDNHVHLLLKESFLGISNLMQRIGTAYALYYNRRHGRSGPVFESRYTSCPVEGTRYFNNALTYIHNNPVAAGIVETPADYHWCSAFYFRNNNTCFLIKDSPLKNTELSTAGTEMPILECAWPTRISDFTIIKKINQFCKKYKIYRAQLCDYFEYQKEISLELFSIQGITKAQISRLVYISIYKLSRILIEKHSAME